MKTFRLMVKQLCFERYEGAKFAANEYHTYIFNCENVAVATRISEKLIADIYRTALDYQLTDETNTGDHK